MKYSIVVIAGSFTLSFLIIGVNVSFGLIFSEILDYFDEGKGNTGWIASLSMGVMFISGPIVGIITKRIGYRWASVLGSILAAVGMAANVFVNSMFYLYFTYGVIAGFGFGIVNFVRLAIVNLQFDKRRSLAMGIASSGAGIGTILLPLLIEKCLRYYGWRGTFLILSGLCLQGVIFGALFRTPISDVSPDTLFEKKSSSGTLWEEIQTKSKVVYLKRNKETSKSQKRTSFFNQCLFLPNKVEFSMLLLSGAVMSMAYPLPYVMLPDLISEKGMETQYAAVVVTTTEISGICCRFLIGFLADRCVNRFILHGLVAIAVGGATIPCGFLESFPVFVAYGVVFGIFTASCAILQSVLLVDVVGKKDIGLALSIMFFTYGILNFIGPPIGGWISDWTGSYHGTFYFAGAAYIFGGIVTCCIPVYTKYNRKIDKN